MGGIGKEHRLSFGATVVKSNGALMGLVKATIIYLTCLRSYFKIKGLCYYQFIVLEILQANILQKWLKSIYFFCLIKKSNKKNQGCRKKALRKFEWMPKMKLAQAFE